MRVAAVVHADSIGLAGRVPDSGRGRRYAETTGASQAPRSSAIIGLLYR